MFHTSCLRPSLFHLDRARRQLLELSGSSQAHPALLSAFSNPVTGSLFSLDLRLHPDFNLHRATFPAVVGGLHFYQFQQPRASSQSLQPLSLGQLSGHLQWGYFSGVIFENQIHIFIISGHHPNTFLSGYNLSTPTYPPITVFSYMALHALDSVTLFQVFLLHWLKTHIFLSFFSLPLIDSWALFHMF